jgi:hypothetical protein
MNKEYFEARVLTYTVQLDTKYLVSFYTGRAGITNDKETK